MGLYDHLELPDRLRLPGLDRDPTTLDWQTKSFGYPSLKTYRITVDGRLLEEEVHTEHVPEEDRPYYGTEKWDDPFFEGFGSVRTVHDGWSRRKVHGIVEFHASTDEGVVHYEARCTEGLVEAIRWADPDDSDWQPFETLIEGGDEPPTPDVQLTRTQVIHLRALLDDLTDELDGLDDHEADTMGGLDGRGYVRVQRARRGVEFLRQYLEWRAERIE